MKPSLYSRLNIVSLLLLASCCPDAEPENFIFNIDSVEPVNFNHQTIEFIDGNNGEISASSYAIVIETTAPSIKNAKAQILKGGIFRSPDCSGVIDPLFVLEDQIVGLNITATEALSQTYPVGAELSQLFSPVLITKDNSFSTPPSLVDDIAGGVNFQDLNRNLIRHHEVVDYMNQRETSFYGLKLLEQPPQPVLLRFKLAFALKSGRMISGLTKPILLK